MLAGLVTAWRLASWPTSRSPVLVKATTDGIGPAALRRCDDGRLAALHDGDDGVRRAEVDADDLAHGRWCSLFGVGGRSGRMVSVGSVASRDGHEGRAEDAVAEAVAAPDLLDDLALGPVRCRARWRSPRARAGRTACRASRRSSVTPSLSRSRRSLRSMAAMPSNQGSSAIDVGSRLDGAVEVVGDGRGPCG